MRRTSVTHDLHAITHVQSRAADIEPRRSQDEAHLETNIRPIRNIIKPILLLYCAKGLSSETGSIALAHMKTMATLFRKDLGEDFAEGRSIVCMIERVCL